MQILKRIAFGGYDLFSVYHHICTLRTWENLDRDPL